LIQLQGIKGFTTPHLVFLVHITGRLAINRLSLIIQPGFYLYRTKYGERSPATYQRIGIKYNILKDISLGINMHAYYFSIADYIEWTIGYRLHL
jgi:hypothetical protein